MASVVTGSNPAPSLGSAEYDLGPLTAFVMLDGLAARFPARDAGLCPSVAPPVPAVVAGLGRAARLRRISPPQAIAIDEYYPTQYSSVIDARLTMAIGKEGLKPRHLRVRQPDRIAHEPASLRRLTHATGPKLMSPDPKAGSRARLYFPYGWLEVLKAVSRSLTVCLWAKRGGSAR